MNVLPAIDLREGACVQLVGGAYADERVRLDDPVAVARGWRDAGFRRLHVVDLDAATGRGSNDDIVRALIESRVAEIQVGGGVRTTERVDELLDLGASTVVVGTRALEDPTWCDAISNSRPGRIVVAVDVRNRSPVTRGWTRTTSTAVSTVLGRLARLPLAAILVTAVDVEGRMEGPDLRLVDDAQAAVTTPLMVAGGIATLADLRALRARKVSAAIVGMALYTGALAATQVVAEFAV